MYVYIYANIYKIYEKYKLYKIYKIPKFQNLQKLQKLQNMSYGIYICTKYIFESFDFRFSKNLQQIETILAFWV